MNIPSLKGQAERCRRKSLECAKRRRKIKYSCAHGFSRKALLWKARGKREKHHVTMSKWIWKARQLQNKIDTPKLLNALIQVLEMPSPFLTTVREVPMTIPGTEEGAMCNRFDSGDACKGVLEYRTPDDCYCHISPPCSSCVNNPLRCPECGWEEEK